MCSVKLRTRQERQGRFFIGSLFQRVLCSRGFFVSKGSSFQRVPSEGVPDVTFRYFLTGAPKCVLVTPFSIFERCRIRALKPAVLPRRRLPTQPLVSMARAPFSVACSTQSFVSLFSHRSLYCTLIRTHLSTTLSLPCSLAKLRLFTYVSLLFFQLLISLCT